MRRARTAEPVRQTREEIREQYLAMSAQEHREQAVKLLVDAEYQGFAPAQTALAARAQAHLLLAMTAS